MFYSPNFFQILLHSITIQLYVLILSLSKNKAMTTKTKQNPKNAHTEIPHRNKKQSIEAKDP